MGHLAGQTEWLVMRALGVHQMRVCERCHGEFIPTGNCQKYCTSCTVAARKVKDAKSNERRSAVPGHKAQILANQRGYYAVRLSDPLFRAETAERGKSWKQSHPEDVRLGNLEWKHAHPEYTRFCTAKRRALKYGNTPIAELLTEAQWRDILDEYRHRCAYCGKKVDKLTIDHVVALSKGGEHSASNVVPACLHCNCAKGAKTTEEWVGLASEVRPC